MLRLAVKLFMVPVRTFFFGIEVMAEALRNVPRMAAESLGSVGEAAGSDTLRYPEDGAESLYGEDHGGPGPPLENVDIVHRDVENKPIKKESKMDQDLSGKMVKVVQYTIISVVTGVADDARVLLDHPRTVAFADDMTPEDFSSWIIASNCDTINDYWKKDKPTGFDMRLREKKYWRVAFVVMGRFSPADINYDELQALALANIAHQLEAGKPPIQVESRPHDPEGEGNGGAAKPGSKS